MTEHGLSPQQAERSLRRQCLFLRSLQQAEPVPRKRSVFLQVPVQLSWCRPFSFCVRQSFPAAALLPPGQSSAPRRAQCSGRRQRQRLRPRSDSSLEKRRLQCADPLFFSSEGSTAAVSAGRSAAAGNAAGFAFVCADASDVRHSLGADASGSSKAPWSVGAAASALKASATAEDIGASLRKGASERGWPS